MHLAPHLPWPPCLYARLPAPTPAAQQAPFGQLRRLCEEHFREEEAQTLPLNVPAKDAVAKRDLYWMAERSTRN